MVFVNPTWLAAFLFCAAALPAAGNECAARKLSQKTLALVKPILAYAIENQRRAASGLPELKPYIEERLETIFRDRSVAGNEAIAYFLNIYIGEGAGELLVMHAIRRGDSMRLPIETYERCLPITGMEPLPAEMKGSGILPKLVFEGFGALKGIGRSRSP